MPSRAADSKYLFASTEEEFTDAVHEIGMPCIVKPIMSSSGKGQSVVSFFPKIGSAWKKAQKEGRAGSGKVIVEEIIDFDYEITLLTLRSKSGTSFCEPIGHKQVDGDYVESWQPHPMSGLALIKAKEIAKKESVDPSLVIIENDNILSDSNSPKKFYWKDLLKINKKFL